MLNLKGEANNNRVIVGCHSRYPSKVGTWSVESSNPKSVQVNIPQSPPSAASAATGLDTPFSGIGNGYPTPPPMYSNKKNGSSWRNDTMEMQGFNDVAKNVESGFGVQLH